MKSKTTKIFFMGMLLTASIVLITCKQATEPENNVGLIMPGEGMAGIKLGDSKATVLEKLGNPTGIGIADGFDNVWAVYNYNEGEYNGLCIEISSRAPGKGGGYWLADEFEATSPFSGKTKEGIGIGSSLKDVHKTYGLPVKSSINSENYLREFYCISNKKFEVGYKDSAITFIAIGYYVPRSNDQYYPCND